MAWSLLTRKGSTVRLMWFYSRSEAKRHNLWFATVVVALFAAKEEGLCVDLGPGGRTKETKEMYGFKGSVEWREGYEGEYRDELSGLEDAAMFLLGDKKARDKF